MAASLCSPPPLPSAFRRSRAVVRASSSSSSSSAVSSSSSAPKARFVARRSESVPVQQLVRPLAEYMSLPASQYSVLDAERIERVDDSTFRCYVYRFRFFALEVCPVLLVRVDEEPDGCCIRLLSCKLFGFACSWRDHRSWRRRMINSQLPWRIGFSAAASRKIRPFNNLHQILQ
uniref:Uncharacterized protein n=1 Tax=Zea mays TaxID=4577 RepID=A0A804LDL4_MAIZE